MTSAFKRYLIIGTCAFLSACVYPTRTVQQGSATETGLYFEGAPPGAIAFVDGSNAGPVEVYDGQRAVLSVAPGPHHITVVVNGSTIYDEQVYVGNGSNLAVEID